MAGRLFFKMLHRNNVFFLLNIFFSAEQSASDVFCFVLLFLRFLGLLVVFYTRCLFKKGTNLKIYFPFPGIYLVCIDDFRYMNIILHALLLVQIVL